MVFGPIFYASMNINVWNARNQCDITYDRANGYTRTALLPTRSATVGQCPATTDTQGSTYRSAIEQFNFGRLDRLTDQGIVLRWTVVIQVANITTIDKAVEAAEDCTVALVGYGERAVFGIDLD